jgi:hypothetical protein
LASGKRRQSSVGEADLEAREQLGRGEASALQVLERRRRLRQPLLVVADELVEKLLVGRLVVERRRKLRHRRRLHRTGLEVLVAEQLDRVAEADALALHHPVDDGAADAAGAEAVPEVLLRADGETRRLVLVEGAAAHERIAALLELHAEGHHQPLERDLFLQSLQFCIGKTGQIRLPSKIRQGP